LISFLYYVFYEAKQHIFSTKIPLYWELHCSYEKCPTVFLKATGTMHANGWHKPHVAREPRTAHYFLSKS